MEEGPSGEEKFPQILKKFPAFYEKGGFITAFKTTRQ
jgi:hypothetical protein